MTTFKEIGAYLDKLELEKKFDLIAEIAKDVLDPKIKKASTPDKLEFSNCSPRVNYQCVQLTERNVSAVRNWLLTHSGFYDVTIQTFGLDTEYGHLKWNEWIVQEPNSAVVFYSEEVFLKCYHV